MNVFVPTQLLKQTQLEISCMSQIKDNSKGFPTVTYLWHTAGKRGICVPHHYTSYFVIWSIIFKSCMTPTIVQRHYLTPPIILWPTETVAGVYVDKKPTKKYQNCVKNVGNRKRHDTINLLEALISNRLGHMIHRLSYHIKDITCALLAADRISSAEPRGLRVKGSRW